MQTVTSAVMREIDQRAIQAAGIPGETLMERAGFGLAEAVDRLCAGLHGRAGRPPTILMIAGHGNNGGDIFAAARHLHARGRLISVWLAADMDQVRGDAQIHMRRMRQAGLDLLSMPAPDDWHAATATPDVIVDGLLGTGISGPARNGAAAAIAFINRHRPRARVVAVDVPSGLNADDGTAPGPAVRADLTVTMALPKTGFLSPAALEYIGVLEVVDIGIPASCIPAPDGAPELIAAADLAWLHGRRARTAHKGDYGHLLIIAGARGYAGAAILAARAALRSGVGLVSLLAPGGIRAELAAAVPEAMVHATPENDAGAIAELPPAWRDILLQSGQKQKFSAILAGPGLTPHPDIARLVTDVLLDFPGPLLLDADALNVLAGNVDQIAGRRATVTITPHPGEMARLLDISTAAVQSDRFGAARAAVARTGGTVVLKGAGTIVAAPDQPLRVNLNGNPGMAKGGSGDVLAGLLGGLLARLSGATDAARIHPAQAAQAAVHLHGRAGDHAAARLTETAMTAGDIIDSLPHAWSFFL